MGPANDCSNHISTSSAIFPLSQWSFKLVLILILLTLILISFAFFFKLFLFYYHPYHRYHDYQYHIISQITITFEFNFTASIFINIRNVFNWLLLKGYYVELLREPWTCFDSMNYRAILVVDPEETFALKEIEKIVRDIRSLSRTHKLSHQFTHWLTHSLTH